MQLLVVIFPLIVMVVRAKQTVELYTADSIYRTYDETFRGMSIESTAVREMLHFLVKVVAQHSNRLDFIEQTMTTVRSEVNAATADSTYVKQFMFEQMSLYHNVGEARKGLARTADMFLPWDNYFQDKTRLVVGDIVAMNETLNSMHLQVSTMHQHLEEVEKITLDVKKHTVDNFATILNNAIPILEERVEERYKRILEKSNSTKPPALSSTFDQKSSKLTCDRCAALNIHQSKDYKTLVSNSTGIALFNQSERSSLNESERSSLNESEGSSLNQSEGVALNDSQSAFLSQSELSDMYGEKQTGEIMRVREKTQVKVVQSNRSNHIIGSWMQDGYNESSVKVWEMRGYRKLSTLVEYNNIVTFMNRITSHSYKLPFYCGGTGHVVYNSSFYCPAFKSDKIYRYDLRTNTYIYTKLKGKGVHNLLYGYSIKGFNNVDILSDSAGLWVLYTNQDVAGRIILLKIDSVTMETHFIAYTHSRQTDYMNCFMVEGTLYALVAARHGVGVVIQRVWSVHDSPEYSNTFEDTSATTISSVHEISLEPSGSSQIMSADYNVRYARLYTWNLDSVSRGKATLKWFVFDFSERSTPLK